VEQVEKMDVTRRQWLSGASAASAGVAIPGIFDVRTYKAAGDGKTLDTKAIQAAIDACTAAGGGRVVLSGGRFLTGTLYLKSNVILFVEAGAVLLGSPNLGDYATDTHRNMYAGEPQLDRCLLFARDADNIGLEGPGTIDGQGKSFPNTGDPSKSRPMMIRFINCKKVSLRDVTLLNPAAWTSAFLYCSDIAAHAVTVSSRANGNGDGMDFDGCQDVRISDCNYDNSDDCICLQGSDPAHPVRNVVITNCVMTSRWAAIRIGLLSQSDFRDVTVSNCVFHDHRGEGLKIQMTEGGKMENLLFSNIVMRNVPRAILVTFNSFPMRINSPKPMPAMQSLRNLMFSHIRIESDNSIDGPQLSYIAVCGLPDHAVENITFSDISFTAPGGGDAKMAARRSVGEFTDVRPESRVFEGSLPTYGLYARHVKGLTVRNVTLDAATKDVRPGIICDDVEGVVFSGVRVACDADNEHAIRLQNTRDVLIEGSGPSTPCQVFVRVEGDKSNDIAVTGNDLRRAAKAVDRAAEVPARAILFKNNLDLRK
jgi:polygalacturonase